MEFLRKYGPTLVDGLRDLDKQVVRAADLTKILDRSPAMIYPYMNNLPSPHKRGRSLYWYREELLAAIEDLVLDKMTDGKGYVESYYKKSTGSDKDSSKRTNQMRKQADEVFTPADQYIIYNRKDNTVTISLNNSDKELVKMIERRVFSNTVFVK